MIKWLLEWYYFKKWFQFKLKWGIVRERIDKKENIWYETLQNFSYQWGYMEELGLKIKRASNYEVHWAYSEKLEGLIGIKPLEFFI